MLPTLKHCHGISCNTDLSKESFSGEQWKKSHADNTRRCKACILGKVELMKDTIIGAPVCQTIQTKLTGVAGPSSAAPLALACAPLARSAVSSPLPSTEHPSTQEVCSLNTSLVFVVRFAPEQVRGGGNSPSNRVPRLHSPPPARRWVTCSEGVSKLSGRRGVSGTRALDDPIKSLRPRRLLPRPRRDRRPWRQNVCPSRACRPSESLQHVPGEPGNQSRTYL